MKLSKDTIEMLKNFKSINPSIFLKKGNVINTKAPSGAIYAEYVLNDDEEIDFDAAIYDLNGFLNILSLSGEDAEIKESDNNAELIIEAARSKVHWPVVEPETITYPKNRINFPPEQVKFELLNSTLSQILKIARGVGADTLCIDGNDSKVNIVCYNKGVDIKLSKPLSKFEIEDAEVDDGLEFNFVIEIKNLHLSKEDFIVKLWAKGSNYAAKFEGPTSTYILAVEKESVHNF